MFLGLESQRQKFNRDPKGVSIHALASLNNASTKVRRTARLARPTTEETSRELVRIKQSQDFWKVENYLLLQGESFANQCKTVCRKGVAILSIVESSCPFGVPVYLDPRYCRLSDQMLSDRISSWSRNSRLVPRVSGFLEDHSDWLTSLQHRPASISAAWPHSLHPLNPARLAMAAVPASVAAIWEQADKAGT